MTVQVVCPLYGISLFLPTIIKNLGYQSSQAQLMTVPIYITAAILAVIVAYCSDKVGKRSPFILGPYLMMIIGFSMCIATDPKEHPRVVYGGVYLVACGIYPAFPGVISWLSNNLSGSLKRSVGMALQIGIGNLGGVSRSLLLPDRDTQVLTCDEQAMASNFYRAKDGPRYKLGHSLELGFIGMGIVASLVLLAGYSSENRKRARKIDEGALDLYTPEELSEQGDKAITFRYVY
jgi:MFS family permease